MDILNYLMLSTARCANRETYAVSRDAFPFHRRSKTFVNAGVLCPSVGVSWIYMRCNEKSRRKSSIALDNRWTARVSVTYRKCTIEGPVYRASLVSTSSVYCIIYITCRINIDTDTDYFPVIYLPTTPRVSRDWKYWIRNIEKNIFNYFARVYCTKFLRCERHLRSIRHKLRLVGGQGKERKDERMRPGEVVRRCCGSRGSKVAEITARTWWLDQSKARARTPSLCDSSESISDKYCIFMLPLLPRVHVILVCLNFLAPGFLESRRRRWCDWRLAKKIEEWKCWGTVPSHGKSISKITAKFTYICLPDCYISLAINLLNVRYFLIY